MQQSIRKALGKTRRARVDVQQGGKSVDVARVVDPSNERGVAGETGEEERQDICFRIDARNSRLGSRWCSRAGKNKKRKNAKLQSMPGHGSMRCEARRGKAVDCGLCLGGEVAKVGLGWGGGNRRAKFRGRPSQRPRATGTSRQEWR